MEFVERPACHGSDVVLSDGLRIIERRLHYYPVVSGGRIGYVGCVIPLPHRPVSGLPQSRGLPEIILVGEIHLRVEYILDYVELAEYVAVEILRRVVAVEYLVLCHRVQGICIRPVRVSVTVAAAVA